MEKAKQQLDIAQKTVEQLVDGFRKGPIIFIISFLMVALIFSVILNFKFLLESRDREGILHNRVVEEVRKQAPGVVYQEVQPIREQVGHMITKTDTTLNKTDSLLHKVDSMLIRR